MKKTDIEILECTLRDGSYSIDFQFTPEDTAVIVAALEWAGFTMIEIGHGMGLNASKMGKGVAAASDEDYMKAAQGAVSNARWGMFYIPGIGKQEDLDKAISNGVGFLRIGTNATEVNQSFKTIEYLSSKEIPVFCNLMKSYTLQPEELALCAKNAEKHGATGVYIVDSAGYMLPSTVAEYVNAIKEKTSIPIGFHGHDNLSLGCANCLSAAIHGAKYVDSTLMGIGRGGGNPATESLVAILEKAGFDQKIDTKQICDISYTFIQPLSKTLRRSSLDIISGIYGFHSSYLNLVLSHAFNSGVDPRDLIKAVCEFDKIEPSKNLISKVASTLKRKQDYKSVKTILTIPKDTSSESIPDTETIQEKVKLSCQKATSRLFNIARKTGRLSVLNIVATKNKNDPTCFSEFIHEDFDYVLNNVIVNDEPTLKEILLTSDGIVDCFLVDIDIGVHFKLSPASHAHNLAEKARVISYRDKTILCRSIQRLVIDQIDSMPTETTISIYGTGSVANSLEQELKQYGFNCYIHSSSPMEDIQGCYNDRSANMTSLPPKLSDITILIVLSGQKSISKNMINSISSESCIIDTDIGCLTEDAWQLVTQKGITVLRPDMRAALDAEIRFLLNSSYLNNDCRGITTIKGIPVVAGGVVGKKGDIVIDSVSSPTKVVGIADGRGRVLSPSRSNINSVNIIKEYILQSRLLSDVKH